jgi:hypothetical protein
LRVRGGGAAEQRQLLLELLVRALLRLHHERAAAVEVDAAGAGRAVLMTERDRVLKGVAVMGGV